MHKIAFAPEARDDLSELVLMFRLREPERALWDQRNWHKNFGLVRGSE